MFINNAFFLLQRVNQDLHPSQNLLFRQPSPDDLNRTRQALHPDRVVIPISAFFHPICGFPPGFQRIEFRIHFSHRDDTGGIVQEIPEEGVAAGGDGVGHAAVREGGGGVDGTQDEVEGVGGLVPPGEPGGFEGFALSDETPLFGGGFRVEVAE